MELILSPKDNINKLVLKGVETFAIEGSTLLVVYLDGRCRNYPMTHLWYWESKVPGNRSKPNYNPPATGRGSGRCPLPRT